MDNARTLTSASPLSASPAPFFRSLARPLRTRISQVMKRAMKSVWADRSSVRPMAGTLPAVVPTPGKISAISSVEYGGARRPGVRGHWKSSDRVSMFLTGAAAIESGRPAAGRSTAPRVVSQSHPLPPLARLSGHNAAKRRANIRVWLFIRHRSLVCAKKPPSPRPFFPSPCIPSRQFCNPPCPH